MNSVRSNSLSLKYHRFTPSGSKDIGIRKFEFVKRLIPFHSGSRPGTIALPLYSEHKQLPEGISCTVSSKI